MSAAIIGLFLVAAQTLGLPAEGWITGDQGAKYLQARAFAIHGPLNPAIDVLARDIDPEYRHQEPKLKNRGGRLVSEFLWLLPLLTAPFFRLLGMHGLYVVPGLSVIVIFLAAAALGRRFGEGDGLRTAWVAILVTPVVLYGLEFWEHAPAAACVLVAAVLLFPEQDAVSSAGDGSRRLRLAGAGAMIGAGALFREEVIAALPALVIARGIAVPAARVKTLIAASIWTMVGIGAVLLAAVPVNLMMYGAPLPMHMTQDAWQVAINTPYLSVRREVIAHWLLPGQYVWAFVAAAGAGLAAAMIQAWRARTRPDAQPDAISNGLLIIVHLSALVILAACVGSPMWRLLHGFRVQDAYDVPSAAHTWPFAVALFYAPWFVTSRTRPAARYAIASGVLLVLGTMLLVPTDGGAQWSPRFLLAAAPLFAIVAAEGTRLVTSGGRRGVRWMVIAILLASMVMQVHGLMWLRGGKVSTARMTEWIGHLTEPDDVVISNVFWVPELAASLAPTRRMLFSWSSADVPALASVGVSHGLRRFTVVTSITLTGYDAPPAMDVPGAPCRFTRGLRIPITFGLVVSKYACGR